MIADTTCAVLRAWCCAPAGPLDLPIRRRRVRKLTPVPGAEIVSMCPRLLIFSVALWPPKLTEPPRLLRLTQRPGNMRMRLRNRKPISNRSTKE